MWSYWIGPSCVHTWEPRGKVFVLYISRLVLLFAFPTAAISTSKLLLCSCCQPFQEPRRKARTSYFSKATRDIQETGPYPRLIMDAFTPQQTIELCSRIGCKKAHMRLDKLFFNSVIAGPLLGFGCAVLVSTTAAPWFQENAPGLIRTIGALVFPVGLVMIVLSGADLFTSNVMFMITALLHRRVTVWDTAKVWFVSFFGNLAGTLFFMAIITGYGGVFEAEPVYRTSAINLAVSKAYNPQWHQIFLRAIGANWLVCFAVFISISSREIASKIIAIWFPTATFVALGLDHVIANMFFVPMGIWLGAPFGAGFYIWKSLIPTLLGNIVGGGLFVGAA